MGQVFLPRDEALRARARSTMEQVAASLGFEHLAWRVVPTSNASLGASALSTEPLVEQWFISATGSMKLDAEAQVRSSSLSKQWARLLQCADVCCIIEL